MARPKTATKILELKGSFKTHPERKRKHEPEPNSVFCKKPPTYLTASQKKAWREVVKITPAGVLVMLTRYTSVVACLLAEFRERQGNMETSRIARLTQEMGKLGLNPSARASLVVEKPKVNKYAD